MSYINANVSDTYVKNMLSGVSVLASNGVFGYCTNKDEWSQALLKLIPSDQLFPVYGGTMWIEPGKKSTQLAL